jgi:hypothetical protein
VGNDAGGGWGRSPCGIPPFDLVFAEAWAGKFIYLVQTELDWPSGMVVAPLRAVNSTTQAGSRRGRRGGHRGGCRGG